MDTGHEKRSATKSWRNTYPKNIMKRKTGMKKIVGFTIILTLCCFLSSCGHIYLLNNDELSKAIFSGNLEAVKEAVDNGADVNKGSFFYALHEVPLLYSMREKPYIISEYLLSNGADPNYIDKNNGISLLMYAVGARPEGGVHYAAFEHSSFYKTLLSDERTDVNLTGKLGYSALDYACRDNGRREIVNDLINHGARITATTMKCAFEGYEAGNCEESVIKRMYDSITEQNIPSGLDPEIEAAIKGDSGKLIPLANGGKIKQENKHIVMLLTCAFGNAEAFKALTDEDNDLNTRFLGERYWGKTYLGVSSSYGNLDIIKYLLDENADIEILSRDSSSYQEKTPLTYALQNNHPDVADYLFERGAKLQIAASGTSGGRPDVLEIVCENGNIEAVKWVVEHGYPLDEERLQKAMSEAARNDHIDVLKYFLFDLKADINSEYYFSTVLGCAGIASFETVKFLIDNGANINGGKDNIWTPLDRAVSSNRADMVLYLIEQGADVNLVGTDDGYTPSRPLTVAIQNGYFEIVKILVEHGAELDYKEGWVDGKDTPLEIAEGGSSHRIADYIRNALNDK